LYFAEAAKIRNRKHNHIILFFNWLNKINLAQANLS